MTFGYRDNISKSNCSELIKNNHCRNDLFSTHFFPFFSEPKMDLMASKEAILTGVMHFMLTEMEICLCRRA